MDARSKANFINSVAGGQKVPCPKCGTLNEADSLFCAACGAAIEAAGKKEEAPVFAKAETPFAPAKKPEAPAAAKAAATPAAVKPAAASAFVAAEEAEEPSVFAKGLPDWDVVPPQVMVRRKRK